MKGIRPRYSMEVSGIRIAQEESKATRVRDYMSNKLVTIDSNTSAFEIANRL